MNHLEAETFALFPFDDRQRVLAFMLAHNIDPHMTLAIKWDGETVTAYQYTTDSNGKIVAPGTHRAAVERPQTRPFPQGLSIEHDDA